MTIKGYMDGPRDSGRHVQTLQTTWTVLGIPGDTCRHSRLHGRSSGFRKTRADTPDCTRCALLLYDDNSNKRSAMRTQRTM